MRRPGKAPALPTSRPVIMGHKPEAQQAQTAVSGVGEASPLLSRRKIEIMPVSGKAAVETKTPAAAASAQEKPAVRPAPAQTTAQEKDALAVVALDAVTGPPPLAKDIAPAEKPQETPAATPAELMLPAKAKPEPLAEQETMKAQSENKPTPQLEAPKIEPTLSADELPAETSSVPEAEPAKETAPSKDETEQTPQEPVIQPLFDSSGAIIVSTHDHHHRHRGLKIFGLMLLILLLAAIAVDLLLDLGILSLEGVPHTDFL
ncbi:MAG TPA: hypothetical protein VIS56_01990 [Candidatus Saccharimonadales bacterium]